MPTDLMRKGVRLMKHNAMHVEKIPLTTMPTFLLTYLDITYN